MHDNDYSIEIRQLKETIAVLQSENAYLASRSEDSLLIGLISEEIGRSDDIDQIINGVLERVSILKDIPFCAYCAVLGQAALIRNLYLSFTSSTPISNEVISLDSSVIDALATGTCLLSSTEQLGSEVFARMFADKKCPRSFLLVRVRNRHVGEGVFIFAENEEGEPLELLQVSLQRIVELLNSRVENLFLISELRKLNTFLDRQVEERTNNLLLVNEKLQHEIVERKKLESQLLRAQKMEAIGTLAGGVAHDFNNLLTSILGYTSLLLHEVPESHPHYPKLKSIESQAFSAAELTKQLLGFAHGGKYEVLPTDLNELVRSTAEMFGRTRKELSIVFRLQPELHVVEVDRVQIEQVLMNLLVNAWQAMPDGGTIILSTEKVVLDQQYCRLREIKEGAYVKIAVADTGIGMDEATQKRIFEPFFTTKEKGIGTGLGLASAYGIIRNHGGVLNVYSEVGHGSTFSVFLPQSDKEIPSGESIAKGLVAGMGTILLVDDQDIVSDVGADMLHVLGYDVLVARSGQEAIRIYSEKRDSILLVILDMIMPGMSGSETFDRLKQINPDVCIILSSGYSINGLASAIIDKGCAGFIQKPFNLQSLSSKIQQVVSV